MPNYTRLMYACTTNALPCTIKKHFLQIIQDLLLRIEQVEITGVLVCGNDYIFHCIEVPTESIERIQQAVAKNTYSHAFKLLHCEPVSQRYFQSWDVKYFMQDHAIEQFFIKHDWEKFNPYILHGELLQQFMPFVVNGVVQPTEADWEEARRGSSCTGIVIHYRYMVVVVIAVLTALAGYLILQYLGLLPASAIIVP